MACGEAGRGAGGCWPVGVGRAPSGVVGAGAAARRRSANEERSEHCPPHQEQWHSGEARGQRPPPSNLCDIDANQYVSLISSLLLLLLFLSPPSSLSSSISGRPQGGRPRRPARGKAGRGGGPIEETKLERGGMAVIGNTTERRCRQRGCIWRRTC